MSKPTLAEQVATLTTQVCSERQKAMIEDLKNNGLLPQPTFNLAYGPVSFLNTQDRQ
ncbi:MULTISPECIES: hypothetical protein [Enterobacter]|uniref:hypothetical protein n=1 Tax=Enterobacter TaxID=547 RepID=UPI0013E36B35|nr:MULTISPECIES: hypothetical protein [Enterobacter]HBM0954962.1 hypothetical protein [Enterobacter roggenkampii]